MEFNIEKYHLKSTSFYEMLNADEEAFIKKSVTRIEYKKGQVIFKENSYSKGIYIVRKGKVKISQASSARESILYVYKKGEYFGYRPLLADEPHPVTASALDTVVVSFIPKEVFVEVLNNSDYLPKQLLINLSKEFSVWINKITTFTQHNVKERVALSLLILGRVYQTEERNNGKVVITMNRDDFASFVGTAKESLVRMLRVFKDEGVITSKGSNITVIRPKALYGYLNW